MQLFERLIYSAYSRVKHEAVAEFAVESPHKIFRTTRIFVEITAKQCIFDIVAHFFPLYISEIWAIHYKKGILENSFAQVFFFVGSHITELSRVEQVLVFMVSDNCLQEIKRICSRKRVEVANGHFWEYNRSLKYASRGCVHVVAQVVQNGLYDQVGCETVCQYKTEYEKYFEGLMGRVHYSDESLSH